MTSIDTSKPLTAVLNASNEANAAVMQAIADAQCATVVTKAAPKGDAKPSLQGTSTSTRDPRTVTLEDGTVATYR